MNKMNKLQLSALVLNQITQIKFGRDLAPNASAFRQSFKQAYGLSKKASHLEVLKALGQVYKENKIEQEFFDKLKNLKAENLVTPEMLA